MKEAEEQKTLFDWADWNTGKYPELRFLFHVPNGGSRNVIEAANLKRQGVKAGVPDLCLPVARKKFHGLYIELKRKGGRVSERQSEWLSFLDKQGYKTAVCYGWEEASRVIMEYLEIAEVGNV